MNPMTSIEFENDSACISWHAEQEYVSTIWYAIASSAAYQEILEADIVVVQRHQARRLFADIRKLGLLREADTTWTAYHFIPRVVAAGVHSLAILVPESAIFKRRIQRLDTAVQLDCISHTTGRLTIGTFFDQEAALTWLFQQTGSSYTLKNESDAPLSSHAG